MVIHHSKYIWEIKIIRNITLEIHFTDGIQTCEYSLQTVILVETYVHKIHFDLRKPFCIFQDNNDSKCNVIQIYLQAKSLKVYTGLLWGSGVWETERNSLLITSETPEAKWHFMISCHANSGGGKDAMIFQLSLKILTMM